MELQPLTFGGLLRGWRARRGLSQLALAVDAEVSQRHLSFIESGRSQPSPELVLRLAEHLTVPLRERNALLVAAGYAPRFRETPLSDPALAHARGAIERILKGHEPYPALAVDRHWTMVAANRAVSLLTAAVRDRRLLAPPVNVLRLSLHPDGLAPFIANLAEWRSHLLGRLRRQAGASGDGVLVTLIEELTSYSEQVDSPQDPLPGLAGIAVPLSLRTPAGVLSFISTTTVFGAPTDITLAEVAVEAFFPEDEATTRALRTMADAV